MNAVNSITAPAPPSPGHLRATTAPPGEGFARTLAAAAGDAAALRDAAEQFVAGAFIVPALDALHQDTFNDEGPFAPGPAEKRFAPLLDQHLADRITKAARFPLVDVIVDRLQATRSAVTGGSRT